MASRCCATCGTVLDNVGRRILCPTCRAPAVRWLALDDDGRCVGASTASATTLAPGFMRGLRRGAGLFAGTT